MMQKKTCREKMEADSYPSESASETSKEENNSNSPIQLAGEVDDNSNNEIDFEGPSPLHSRSPSPDVATASSPQQPGSPNGDGDSDDDNETCWIEEFPYPAGVPIGEGVSCFEEWRRDQKKRKEPPWSPFENREEWELAKWLITSGISQKKIDALLNLKMVSFTIYHEQVTYG
jgi:hypothetical protein